jgi:hypothetical protein
MKYYHINEWLDLFESMLYIIEFTDDFTHRSQTAIVLSWLNLINARLKKAMLSVGTELQNSDNFKNFQDN